jgi:integrase
MNTEKLHEIELELNGNLKRSFADRLFDPQGDRWEVDPNKSINLHYLRQLDKRVQVAARKVFLYYAQNYSIGHTDKLSYAFKHYIYETEVNSIDLSSLLNYKSSLSKLDTYRFGVLRVFLRKWFELGYEGVTKEIIEEIYKYKVPGNIKGAAVKSLDPEKGPYSDIEFEAIRDKCISHFAEKKITLEYMVLASLIIESGRRGIQVSWIKIKDFEIDSKSLETPFYSLNIPRAKQRFSPFRATFKFFAMNEQLGSLMAKYIKELKIKLKNSLITKLSDEEMGEFPLFPFWKNVASFDSAGCLVNELIGRELHRKSAEIGNILIKTIYSLNIVSERTSRPLVVSCRRFRYTLGTRAAREGYGKSIIAELLDHSDDQHADVYTKNVPEKGAKISSFMDAKLIEFANAFQGNIVNEEKNAERGDDISSRIESEEGDNVGTCGSNGSCYDNAPIACYLCKRFQPWLDAPHRLVLDKLVYDRNKINEKTGDETITAVNDRVIIAVMQVMKKCAQRKMLGENNG